MMDDKIFHDVPSMQGVLVDRFIHTMKLNHCYCFHEGHGYVFQTYRDDSCPDGNDVHFMTLIFRFIEFMYLLGLSMR